MAKKEKHKKELKRKPKYGLFSCVGYMYRLLWKYERGLVFAGIFTVPVSLILTALGLYTPSAILSALENSSSFSYIALVITGLLLARLIFDLGNNIISIKLKNAEEYVLKRMMYIWFKRNRDRDWYLQYDPEIKIMDNRVIEAINNNPKCVEFPLRFADMLTQILNFILFGSVISLLNPVILLLLLFGCIINAIAVKWERGQNYEDRDARNALNKKIRYSTIQLANDFRFAKDIRLYRMQNSFKKRLDHLFSLMLNEQKKLQFRSICVAVISFLVVLLRDSAAYLFLIIKAVRGEVDASSFVLYFSAITSMASLMSGILGTINSVLEGAVQVSDFREAVEVNDRLNRGTGIRIPEKPFSIEFRNVSFRYPEGEKQILDHVTFRIDAGEKIALVGLNGAGKTTLTMLMCGLLLPDEGEILLDGHPLTNYNRDEMYSLFGFIPQNYHLLPISIARNIASAVAEDEIDREKLNHCIATAGLTEKIASLPMGADTPLNREVNKDGIELSGGEIQKLLLARLLYRNPPCIILDEPTAALDPIAEDRIYRKYSEISANATSVFISHRLASTRFCDRIFLLDGANFAEVGSHEELMDYGGKYKELFDIQSKYYREEVESDEK